MHCVSLKIRKFNILYRLYFVRKQSHHFKNDLRLTLMRLIYYFYFSLKKNIIKTNLLICWRDVSSMLI